MNKIEKKNRNVLISSSTISKAGDILFDYASNSFLASLNMGSLALVGIYQTLENLTSIIFNLFGGVIADRFRRKKILILTDFLSGLVCLILGFINVQTWLIYAIVGGDIALSILGSFQSPAYKAMTREAVERDHIAHINSNLQTAAMIIKIGMPVLAIGIYHVIGIHGVLWLDGISFLASSAILLLISPIVEEVVRNEKFSVASIFRDMGSGFVYLFKQKSIFWLIVLSALINFFIAAYNLLLPYGNRMFPLVSGNIYGSFLAAEAVGGIIGAFLSSKINKKLSIGKLMLYLGISGLALAIAPLLYDLLPNLFLLVISPALFNLFLAIFNVQFFSFVQRDVAGEFLGRVFGIIFTVAILFMPIGTVIFTLLLNPNFEGNLGLVGLGIVLLTVIFGLLFKKIKAK